MWRIGVLAAAAVFVAWAFAPQADVRGLATAGAIGVLVAIVALRTPFAAAFADAVYGSTKTLVGAPERAADRWRGALRFAAAILSPRGPAPALARRLNRWPDARAAADFIARESGAADAAVLTSDAEGALVLAVDEMPAPKAAPSLAAVASAR